jgi:hypothetical protein
MIRQRFSYERSGLRQNRLLTADGWVKINNKRLAHSAGIFFLSRQLSVTSRQ